MTLGIVTVGATVPVNSGGSRAVTLGLMTATARVGVMWPIYLYARVWGLVWLKRPPIVAHVGREFVSHELPYPTSRKVDIGSAHWDLAILC